MFPVFLGYEWCHFCLIFLNSQGRWQVTSPVFILHRAQKRSGLRVAVLDAH